MLEQGSPSPSVPPAASETTASSSRKCKSWSDYKDSSDETTPTSKRSQLSRSNSQRNLWRLSTQPSKNEPTLQSSSGGHKGRRLMTPSLYATGSDPWENRILSCIVVSPAGRVVGDFRSTKELLASLRDVIKAHESLFTIGNILHRDISPNNIIITSPQTAASTGFQGMLIDLDLAKVRDSGPSGARHQTGTMQFMAIEVLRKADHSYRHDLESFFYVLIWTCARSSAKRRRVSQLRKWEVGSFDDIADAKAFHMSRFGLRRVLAEFLQGLEVVQSLAEKLRMILSADMGGGDLNFGTPAGDPGLLYKAVIEAYDVAIRELGHNQATNTKE